MTLLDLSIDQVTRVIEPWTPQRLREPARLLVEWMAHNPPQESTYGTVELRFAHRLAPELQILQVYALVTIAVGDADFEPTDGLLPMYLAEPGFDPYRDRPTLAKLQQYKCRMSDMSANAQ